MTNLMRPGVFNDLVSIHVHARHCQQIQACWITCLSPAGAVPVPVPGRAELGEQPGGPEISEVSGDQRVSAAGTE